MAAGRGGAWSSHQSRAVSMLSCRAANIEPAALSDTSEAVLSHEAGARASAVSSPHSRPRVDRAAVHQWPSSRTAAARRAALIAPEHRHNGVAGQYLTCEGISSPSWYLAQQS